MANENYSILSYSEIIECAICLQPWLDPRECKPCGHVYCGGCIKNLSRCPECREGIASTPVANRYLVNLADAVPVRCNACSWEGQRAAFASHSCTSSPPKPKTPSPPPKTLPQSTQSQQQPQPQPQRPVQATHSKVQHVKPSLGVKVTPSPPRTEAPGTASPRQSAPMQGTMAPSPSRNRAPAEGATDVAQIKQRLAADVFANRSPSQNLVHLQDIKEILRGLPSGGETSDLHRLVDGMVVEETTRQRVCELLQRYLRGEAGDLGTLAKEGETLLRHPELSREGQERLLGELNDGIRSLQKHHNDSVTTLQKLSDNLHSEKLRRSSLGTQRRLLHDATTELKKVERQNTSNEIAKVAKELVNQADTQLNVVELNGIVTEVNQIVASIAGKRQSPADARAKLKTLLARAQERRGDDAKTVISQIETILRDVETSVAVESFNSVVDKFNEVQHTLATIESLPTKNRIDRGREMISLLQAMVAESKRASTNLQQCDVVHDIQFTRRIQETIGNIHRAVVGWEAEKSLGSAGANKSLPTVAPTTASGKARKAP